MPASALVRRVFIGLLVANLAVVGVKLAVGLSSGSLAVLGGAVDSCVDALNNVLALIVVRVAAKEPDEDHPYGHGKFETLGALAIVGFLSITCFELVREAVNHLVSGSHRVDVSDFQLALLVLTLGVNVLITWYEHRRGTELGSELLVTDATHTRPVRPALRRSDDRRRPPRGRGVRARDRRPGGGAPQARPTAPRSHRARGAMLSLSGEQRSRTARRPPRSLKQEYQEFLLQRIEEYKNALTREDLLEIGDEAVRELEESAAGQYLLTEVLLLEHVDRIIARRLRLPSFPRWRQKHRALRAAQRAPTHWGLEPDGPLVSAVRRLEPGDLAVVVGAAALPAALFIAAHDAEVLLVDHDLGAVEGAESRAVTEQLAGRFQALVVTFGSWFP